MSSSFVNHTMDTCAQQALSLVTDLNRRGIYATVRIDDKALHLTIPAYGDFVEPITNSVCEGATSDQCLAFLQHLEDALAYHTNAEARVREIAKYLDTLPVEKLKLMAEEPQILVHIQTAVLRHITRQHATLEDKD